MKKPHQWGFFLGVIRVLRFLFVGEPPKLCAEKQLIRIRAFQTIPMLLFGQFLHVSDGIALIDNFFTEQCLQSILQGHYACGLTVFILDDKEMHLVSDEEIDEFMHGQFV